MARIRVRRTVRASVDDVWDALADIPSHVEWMADARAIRFVSSRRQGVGTTFDCDTKVGPLRLTDRMEITEWSPRRLLRVRHDGIVTGDGAFSLEPRRRGRTLLTWEESLRFPLWLPSLPASLVLRLIWIGNLRRFERSLALGRRRRRLLRVRHHARR